MSDFLTEPWLGNVFQLAKPLSKNAGINLKAGVEINKTPKDNDLAGKVVRLIVEISSGQLKKLETQKMSGGDWKKEVAKNCDVGIRSEYKTALSIVNGELDPDVAYMSGEIKLNGEYHKVLFELRDFFSGKAWVSFWQKVRSSL